MELSYITGASKLTGIIGNPVGHSLSPYIHNYLFRVYNLPFVYIPLEVQREHLPTLIQALRALNFAGANVTVPYKQKVVPYCDVLSELSQLTGTVNTLYWDGGKLCGTTTDAEGFFKALESMGYESTHGSVVILGNGGTARAIALAASHEKKFNVLTIIGRDQSRVDTLASEITQKTGLTVSTALFNTEACIAHCKGCSLLVNCTSVGMYPDTGSSPLPPEVFHKTMTVFDVIYNPAETQLLAYAREAGCRTMNGLHMLVYQGLASFKYWTGVEAGIELLDMDELQSLI
jgi:shikimate dehydrogenase